MKKNSKKSKKPKKTKQGIRPWIVTAASVLFILAVGFLAWLQMSNYEQGILDIYADQQDGYVRLVLDQIHLTEERGGASEDDIANILATLDASSTRYWTLSRQGSLVFVKDVLETNRYQNYSPTSYYRTMASPDAQQAQDFIDSLQMNTVTHSTIQLNSQSYIASGAEFTFQGVPHQVCLLTNTYTILDHNAYLTAKINLYALALIALAAFLVCIEVLFFISSNYRKKYYTEAEDNIELRKQTQKLNDALHKEDLYDARRTAYTAKALPMLWEKLDDKDPWPLTFLILQCAGEEAQQQFLQFTQFHMNEKILRAFLDDEHILLVLLRVDTLELSAIKENIQVPGVLLTGELTLTEEPKQSLNECFNSFAERTFNDEKQTPMQI